MMKTRLKESITLKRSSLSRQEIAEKSQKIENRLFSLSQYKNSKIVMPFVSFDSEVHTHGIIKKALKSKIVVVPKVVIQKMEPSILLDFDSLIPSGKFGILEPIELMKIAYKSIGLVLVPGTVFDMEGYRIGYGFGYYDEFLKKIPKAVKIGLCFDFQVVDKIPREEHDIPVDIIITEKRVIECKKYP